jgi:hypothetical protein
MPDAAAAAGQVKGQVRTHQGPAHTRPVADRGVDVGDRGDSLGNGVDRLAPQRGLQPVGDVPATSRRTWIGRLPIEA